MLEWLAQLNYLNNKAIRQSSNQGVSLVWITAKNDSKWKALKEELSPIDSDSLINQSLGLVKQSDDTAATTKISSTSRSISMVGTSDDTAGIVELMRMMVPTGVSFDSAIAVTKTTVYRNGELVDERTNVKTDDQLVFQCFIISFIPHFKSEELLKKALQPVNYLRLLPFGRDP